MTRNVEETRALTQAWFDGLRAGSRPVVDQLLHPRFPGCGVVVGEDRQFGLTGWTLHDRLDGPACSHWSVPLPTALSGRAIACDTGLASPAPFEGGRAAVAYRPLARSVAHRLKYGRGGAGRHIVLIDDVPRQRRDGARRVEIAAAQRHGWAIAAELGAGCP